MSHPQIDRLREMLDPPVAEAGAELEDITVTPAGKRRVLRVVVDADGGVDLDTTAAISRAVSALLDESDVMGEAAYVLEVTTPGTDRPLTAPRHWRRAAGRLVEIVRTDGSKLTARITASDDGGADVVVEPPKGKPTGKKTEPEPHRVEYADIATATVQVEFGKNKNAGQEEE